MSRDKPWLKMWAEWLGDAKMDRLSLAEQGAWWRLLTLAHECGHIDQTGNLDGALIIAGTPLSLAEIVKSLKIADITDVAVFNQMLEKMESAGSLHWDSNVLMVTHFEERQRASTDTKEARRQRQRDRREKLKEEKGEPPPSSPPDPPITPDLDKEDIYKRGEVRDSRSNLSRTFRDAVPDTEISNGLSVTMAELSRCYERYIGLPNPVDSDRMREFSEYYDTHKGEIDWIEKAFKKAPANKRRWPYVQAILERYIDEGGPDGRAGQQFEREEDVRRGTHATDRPGTSEPATKHKWKVKRSGPSPASGGEDQR